MLENALAFARWDINPVSPGHLLVLTRRHVADFFEVTPAEREALMALLLQAHERVRKDHHPDGFNVGVNVGDAAGQTIGHVHVHLIPRYNGDTPEPRGGVRRVIPRKQSY
ncbi:HIT family protein [Variovorax sp. Sphag1AA]|uniref:HIT family protein n=1 Tax=Variovorax sp. Sphag1AA TaxID=2587027 RepID=UPI0017D0A977|nr:HIT family protein [Variovorax sp. Sphag1AA]